MARKSRNPRGSDENLFSINGAALAISRSRRTIAKALDGVPPDAIRHGLPVWRMQTIIDNVNKRTQATLFTKVVQQGSEVLTGVAAQCALAFQDYHAAEDAMAALPSLAERRAAAPQVAALGREALVLMGLRDTDCGLHEEHVELRGDRLRLLMVRGLESYCEWTSVEAWACIDPGDEESEAA
jgi:hypothetical protein